MRSLTQTQTSYPIDHLILEMNVRLANWNSEDPFMHGKLSEMFN